MTCPTCGVSDETRHRAVQQRNELLAKLRSLAQAPPRGIHRDTPRDHEEADKALLVYINDPEVSEAFRVIERWYE